MENEDLKYLLFKMNISKNGDEPQTLFEYQSELAKEIVETNTGYTNADSLRPYLNQVLKYDGHKAGKPLSSELQQAILATIEKKLSDNKPLLKYIKDNFVSAYELLMRNNEASNYNSDDLEFKILFEWQKKSNRTVVFNREPLEVKWLDGDVNAGKLITVLFTNIFKNLKLEGKTLPLMLSEVLDTIKSNQKLKLKSENRNDQYFFRYYVSSFNVAKNLWLGLIKFINDEIIKLYPKMESKEVFELSTNILNLLNGSKDNLDENEVETSFIKVFKTEGFLLTIPCVYYECAEGIVDKLQTDKNSNHEMLFTFILNENRKRSISIVEDEDLDFWKESIYYPLYWSDENQFKKEDINLFKALSHIKRTYQK